MTAEDLHTLLNLMRRLEHGDPGHSPRCRVPACLGGNINSATEPRGVRPLTK